MSWQGSSSVVLVNNLVGPEVLESSAYLQVCWPHPEVWVRCVAHPWSLDVDTSACGRWRRGGGGGRGSCIYIVALRLLDSWGTIERCCEMLY
jgi:hypothetical protein